MFIYRLVYTYRHLCIDYHILFVNVKWVLIKNLKCKKISEGITLSITDTLIAATAGMHDLALVTKNTKHYPFQELRVEEI